MTEKTCGSKAPALGGCAFRGAKLALQPITDALHLIHGPIMCQGHGWESRPTGTTGPTLHRLALSTDIGELDIIFGGAARLTKTLDALVARYDPPAIFVYQTCLPGMTGDDIDAVCRAATDRLERPILAVDAPGFSGGKLVGASKAGQVLLDKVIGTREPNFRTATDVVLIGDYNVAGEAQNISRLLDGAGFRVTASIPGGGRFSDIAGAHRAQLALSHCSQALGDLGEKFSVRWGVPHIHASFYGAAQTSQTLRAAAEKLVAKGAPRHFLARCKDFVAREEMRLNWRLQTLRPRLAGKRALLMTGGVKTWSLSRVLKDFDMEVVACAAHKCAPADRALLHDAIGEAAIVCDMSLGGVRDLLAGGGVDIVLGGGGLRHEAAAAGLPWVEINHERRMALTGYDGAHALAAAMTEALSRPNWRDLRTAAPW
jgi:nitrogenase molybdenum-cofactor synthesis protein NifE